MAGSFYKRHKKAGTLDELKLRVWRAVVAAEDTLERAMKTPDDTDRVARAIHAAVSVYREYRSLLEGSELEERLQALEELAAAQVNAAAMRN